MAVAALLALIFPVLVSANVWIYAILFALAYGYSIATAFKKNGNYTAKILKGEWSTKLFKKYTVWDMTMFKMTMILFGWLIIVLFPSVLTIHTGWYIAVFAFGLGYFVDKICSTK